MRHADLLALLLPPVSYDPKGERLSVELSAEGAALDRAQANAARVQDAITPYGAAELLPDWERNYGLPDPLLGQDQTLQERLAVLLQRINEMGGLSRDYFLFVALNLGYSVSLTEFQPFTVGMAVEQPLFDDDWVFVWQINAPETTVVEFCVELSAVEEPLQKWGNAMLEAVLRRIAPSHTVLHFAYGGTPHLLLFEEGDGFLLDENNDYLDLS